MGQTKDFLRKLYRQSIDGVRDDFGTKGAFMILALKVCLTAIGIGLFVGLRFLPNDEPVYKIVLAIFASDIIGLFALWVITPVIAIFRMPKVAAQNDKKQKDKLAEIDNNKKRIKLNLETKIDNYGSIIGLDVRNKSAEDMMDCTVKLVKLTTYSKEKESIILFADGDKYFNLRWKTIDFENKMDTWSKLSFWEDTPIITKGIPSYETENVLLFQINQGDWNNAGFSVEFRDCQKETKTIKSKRSNKNRSTIDIGIFLELSFDSGGETIVRQYSQRIGLIKKTIPFTQNNETGYYPPKISYQFTEWKEENDKENSKTTPKTKDNP